MRLFGHVRLIGRIRFIITYWDELVGVTKHSNKHVEQDDDGDVVVGAEHEFADQLRKVVLLLQLKRVQIHQAVQREIHRLDDLKQTEKY